MALAERLFQEFLETVLTVVSAIEVQILLWLQTLVRQAHQPHYDSPPSVGTSSPILVGTGRLSNLQGIGNTLQFFTQDRRIGMRF